MAQLMELKSKEAEYLNTSMSSDGAYQEDEEEEDLFLLGGLLESDSENDSVDREPQSVCSYNGDLKSVSNLLRQDFVVEEATRDYRERTQLVMGYMGTMALCRGERGDLLREAGAVHALLYTLGQLQSRLPTIRQEPNSADKEEGESTIPLLDDEQQAAMELAIACLGALRDLACGNALNRSAVRDYVCSVDSRISGLELLALYLKRYHEYSWQCIFGNNALHLRLLTNVIGVLRNVTHSTRDNCIELHQLGVSSMLIWRLLHASASSCETALPDANQPWREAAFRSAGTLINLSEKCNECAKMCGSDPLLVPVLIEAWGGNNSSSKSQTPLLHLGLAAILHAAKQELPACYEEQNWGDILEKEEERRRIAQVKEEERKKRLLKQQQ